MKYECNLCRDESEDGEGFHEELRIRFSPTRYTFATGVCKKCYPEWKKYKNGEIKARDFLNKYR